MRRVAKPKNTAPKEPTTDRELENSIPDPPEPDIELLDDNDPSTVPSKTIETHTTKTVYASRKKVGNSSGNFEELLLEEDDPPDPLAQMLIGFDDVSEVKLKVKRLPDPPNMRGRFMTPCSDEINCGTITIVNPLEYETEVRDAFGGGRYQLTVLHLGRFKKAGIKIIADPPKMQQLQQMMMQSGMPFPMMPNGQSAMPPGGFLFPWQQAQQLPAKSGISELTERIQEAAALREAFKSLDPVQPIPQGTPPGQMSITEFLMSDKDTRQKIAGAILGPLVGGNSASPVDDKMPWYGKVLMMAVENPMVLQVAGPLIFQTLATIISKVGFTRPQQPGAAPTPQPAQPAPAMPSLQVAPPTAPNLTQQQPPVANAAQGPDYLRPQPQPATEGLDDMEQPDANEPFFKILDGIADYCERNIAFPDLQWLDVLEAKYPAQVAQLKQVITLPLPIVKGIISSYGEDYSRVFALPHADAWLSTLINQIKEREKTNAATT